MGILSIFKRKRKPAFTYGQDGLWTVHNADFMTEPAFASAYKAGKDTGSWRESEIQWRVRVALWAASVGARLEGDFVECGVNLGGISKAVTTYLPWAELDKKFYLFDTFSGFHKPYLTERETGRGLHKEYSVDVYTQALENFRGVANVTLVKGPVPDTLQQVAIEKVAYLSIDMNCMMPEVEAFRFFKPKLATGAVILLDDYGWRGHDEQKKAFDELSREFDLPLLPLPTGQAVLINR